MSLFERKTPSQAEHIESAAKEYREAGTRADELQREISEWRAKPVSLKDCMAILQRHAAVRRQEFDAVLDLRLAPLFDVDIDHEDHERVGLDLARYLAPGAFGQGIYHEAMWGLLSDKLLQAAEDRLKALGAGKGPSIAEKRAKLVELQAEHAAVCNARDHALNFWRRLTGQRAGYP